jgi:hypothetical protein
VQVPIVHVWDTMSLPEAAEQVSEGPEARIRLVKTVIFTRNVGTYSTPLYWMESCFQASRGEFITHRSTVSKDGPQGGGLWLKLCLKVKGKIHALSHNVLVGNKPSTLQTSRAIAHDSSIG